MVNNGFFSYYKAQGVTFLHFILNHFIDFLFFGKQDPQPEGILPLRNASFDPAPYTLKEYAIHIDSNSTHFYIQTLSDSDMQEWMNAFSRAGARKQDIQWPGGVKKDVGRLERPPTVQPKVAAPAPSGGWANSNVTQSAPSLGGGGWGNSNTTQSAPSKSKDESNPRKKRESKDDFSIQKPKAEWGSGSSSGGGNKATPSWGAQSTRDDSNTKSINNAKSWQKDKERSASNADFKPNIVLKTENADNGISLPVSVTKVGSILK